jgi:hypothetical protein
MNKQVTRICSRCGGNLIDPGSNLKATTGLLRRQLPATVLLCSDCTELFLLWFRGGNTVARPRQRFSDSLETKR